MASFATPQRRSRTASRLNITPTVAEKASRVSDARPDSASSSAERAPHDFATRPPLTPIPLFAPESPSAEAPEALSDAPTGVVQARTVVKQVGPGMTVRSANRFAAPPVQRKNTTGLPDRLKDGVEALSGVALDDVRVHYNSAKPAAVQAFAYAQGTDIHVAPGQEAHLPHEAWHVVQQRQGRVAPTMQVNGVAVNDNPSLEREADEMGSSALRTAKPVQLKADPAAQGSAHAPVMQRDHTDTGLKKEAAISEFAGKVKARTTGGKNPLGSIKQWATLNAAAKIAKVTKYVNAELDKTHVPKVTSTADAGSRFNSALFDFTPWSVSIGSQGLDAPMSDDEVADMANSVYHECRHAEQWFRIARLKAGEAPKPKAADLAASLGIPQAVAKAALDRPLKPLTALQKAFHSKKYAERHQNKLDEAAAWHHGIYGAGGAHRGAVYADLANRHAEYMQLVEEVDAWGVGGAAENKIRAVLQAERLRFAQQQAAAGGP